MREYPNFDGAAQLAGVSVIIFGATVLAVAFGIAMALL